MKIKLIGFFAILISLTTGVYYAYRTYSRLFPNVLGSSSSQGTTVQVPDGYSYKLVSTKKGSFYAKIYKANLSKVQVKTVAANKSDCKDNCPTKPLKQYMTENNAIAGMNGGYACPPDYPQCKGKINSYDFALYNSNQKKWINKKALTWFKTAMATFKGSKASFCMDTSKCKTDGVTAAISNFPALTHNGEIVVEKGDIQPYQRNKGTRGVLGTDGTNVYLAVISNVTITEVAYVARALGMTYSLNLDGGGSTAMYVNGAYKAGPGRLLPNAVILVKK